MIRVSSSLPLDDSLIRLSVTAAGRGIRNGRIVRLRRSLNLGSFVLGPAGMPLRKPSWPVAARPADCAIGVSGNTPARPGRRTREAMKELV